MHKLVVFGAARIDAFMDIPAKHAGQLCNLDTKKCVIELSYSAKLPLNDVNFLVGGNGANVAIGSKRLGIESTVVTELGEGVLANVVRDKLEKEGVNMHFVTQTEGVNQGFGAVIVYQGERTILSYYAPERPPFPHDLEGSEWAYLTSVGSNFDAFYVDAAKWIEKTKSRLLFNPGGRQISKGEEWMSKYLKMTEVLIVNREEGEEIVSFGSSAGKDKELLDALCATGAKSVVITDGRNGSFAKEGDKYYRLGILPIDSIERTGAGDSFSTGMISALVAGKSFPDGLLYGTVNAASVIGYIGPEDGLLTSRDLPVWLERAESSGVKVEEF